MSNASKHTCRITTRAPLPRIRSTLGIVTSNGIYRVRAVLIERCISEADLLRLQGNSLKLLSASQSSYKVNGLHTQGLMLF